MRSVTLQIPGVSPIRFCQVAGAWSGFGGAIPNTAIQGRPSAHEDLGGNECPPRSHAFFSGLLGLSPQVCTCRPVHLYKPARPRNFTFPSQPWSGSLLYSKLKQRSNLQPCVWHVPLTARCALSKPTWVSWWQAALAEDHRLPLLFDPLSNGSNVFSSGSITDVNSAKHKNLQKTTPTRRPNGDFKLPNGRQGLTPTSWWMRCMQPQPPLDSILRDKLPPKNFWFFSPSMGLQPQLFDCFFCLFFFKAPCDI